MVERGHLAERAARRPQQPSRIDHQRRLEEIASRSLRIRRRERGRGRVAAFWVHDVAHAPCVLGVARAVCREHLAGIKAEERLQ
eukprot:4784779-Prymnesium_polylepis.2